MENELQLEMQSVMVTQGSVVFKEFEQLKEQALELAAEIEKVEVTDENIKQSKKMLAAVNKRVKELEDRRIVIKRLMLEPYQTFESQVKEIVGIVKSADELVRVQVKDLEERDRVQKHSVLQDLFAKRMVHYSFRDLFCFEDFLHPSHLNKSMSIDAVEKEMVAFLEKLSRDLKAIEVMSNATNVLRYYKDTKDLAAAMTLANEDEQRKKQIESSQAFKLNDEIAYLVSVQVQNQRELSLVELLLKNAQLEYTVDRITTGGF